MIHNISYIFNSVFTNSYIHENHHLSGDNILQNNVKSSKCKGDEKMSNLVKIFEGQEIKVKSDKGETLINLVHTAKSCGVVKMKSNEAYVRWTGKGSVSEKLEVISSEVSELHKKEIKYILEEIENTDDRNSIYMSSWLSKRLALECHSEKANRYKNFLVTLDEARENGQVMVQNNSVDPQTVLQLAQGVQLIGAVVQSMQGTMTQIQEYVKDSINSKDLQIEKTMELIGFRAINTTQLSSKLKEELSNQLGYSVTASSPHYQKAKNKLFKHFKVIKWEDIGVMKFNEVYAFIEGILD
jgi:formylmethanofuran dehydrogenase subunit D